MSESKAPTKLRTMLLLARASNLPTVWSNCLAGWILGGGMDDWGKLLLLCSGTTFLYIGGMFLNDAFDADFDRRFRKDRPIPSGNISEREVWTWGFIWLAAGGASLFCFGKSTATLSSLLMTCIVFYDVIHKKTLLSPIVMASCRCLLYLVAASAAGGVNGFVLWHAFVLSCYITGLSYIAKAESEPGFVRYWPCLFLSAPLVLSYLVNDYDYRHVNIALSVILIAWVSWGLRPILGSAPKNPGASVSALLAGIVLVDLLAVAVESTWPTVAFVALFCGARLFQRFIPAT